MLPIRATRIRRPSSKYMYLIRPVGGRDESDEDDESGERDLQPQPSGVDGGSEEFYGFSHQNETEENHSDVEPASEDESDLDDPIYCSYCSRAGRSTRLMQCSYCFHWIHLDCYNERHGTHLKTVPEGLIACVSLEACKKVYRREVKSGYIVDDLGYLSDIEEDRSSESSLLVIAPPIDFEDSRRPCDAPLDSASERFSMLSSKKPLMVATAQIWARQGIQLDKAGAGIYHEGIRRLLGAKGAPLTKEQWSILNASLPPNNIRRSIESCTKDPLKNVPLIQSFRKAGVEVHVSFWYRDPVEAAIDLHFGKIGAKYGSMTDWSSPRCSTGRLPLLTSKLQNFASSYGITPSANQVIVFVGVYCDDSHSASGNVLWCPCWMWDLSFDPTSRTLEREKAHALLCDFPTASSVEYRFSDGTGTPELAKSRLTRDQQDKAVSALKLKAVEVLLSAIKIREADGYPVMVHGVKRIVRVVLAQFVADMKERRELLGMRRGVYHCSHCYSFPGKDNSAEEYRGKRRTSEDDRIRNEFKTERAGLPPSQRTDSISNDFKQKEGCLGLEWKDDCPFTRVEQSKVFTMAGPYELFNVDALHCKDGVVRYYFKFLAAFCGEKRFVEVTRQFGNEFLDTKRFSMHIMERGIESFHFVPLALYFGQFERNLSTNDRTALFNGACDLIAILNLMTDPCPLYVVTLFEAIVNRFRNHVGWVLKEITPGSKKHHKVTTKMHELFSHVSEQMRTTGVLHGYSTKLFETFHETIKSRYQTSSHRVGDGSASKEIVLSFFYQQVVGEGEQEWMKNASSFRLETTPPTLVARFCIANSSPELDLPELVKRNLRFIFEKVFAIYGDELDARVSNTRFPQLSPAARSRFGSSLRMWIEDEVRQVKRTGVALAVVPGVHKGVYYSGGSFNALVFQQAAEADFNTEDVDASRDSPQSFFWEQCAVEGCTDRHHDRNFQLFCSAARESDSAFAIPVVFFEKCAVGYRLNRLEPSSSSIPVHDALFEATMLNALELIPYAKVRGVCMLRPNFDKQHELRCFIFPGRATFGYNILQ